MPDQSTREVDPADKLRFDQLIPQFLSGDISVEDDAFVKNYLAAHPESINSILFAMQIADTVRHIGAERNQAQATARFSQAFGQKKPRKSFWDRIKGGSGGFIVRPWVPVLLALFALDNAFLLYKEHAYYKTTVANAGGNLIVATADARFILVPGAALDEFLYVADKHQAIIIYSAKTLAGSEVQVDLDDNAEVLALADELADKGLVKREETHIALNESGRKHWVQRFNVKPTSIAHNQKQGSE